MLRRLSLRARLLLGVFLIAGVGLAVADVATYTSLRSFLLDRVDSTLESGHAQVERIAFDNGNGFQGGGDERHGPGPPAQGIDWYQVRTLAGNVLTGEFLVGGGSPPDVSNTIKMPAAPTSRGPLRVSYFTVSSKDGSTSYRVRASIEPEHPNRVFLIASSLHDVYGTLHRLLLIELLVTLAVLGGIAGVGMWVVRIGLKPLRAIEATAAMIAAGDLSPVSYTHLTLPTICSV